MTRICRIIMLWLLATAVWLPWSPLALAQDSPQAALFKPEELEQLVAPIALYPDALLAQILMASTYPLDIVSAARWVKANPNLKDQALDDALQAQTWDPSVKIEPASLQVLYVPTYNPTVVYGAWPYPAYPPYAYYPPGYVAATSFMSFGVGVLDA